MIPALPEERGTLISSTEAGDGRALRGRRSSVPNRMALRVRRHPPSPATVVGAVAWRALALAGVVLAAGCGGGRSSGYNPPGRAAASPISSETVPSQVVPSPVVPSDSPSGSPAKGRTALPELEFPRDLEIVYRASDTAEPEAAGAVRALGEFWKAWWYAIASGGGDRRYRDYIEPGSGATGTALFTGVVNDWKREGVRPVGVIRAYGIRVLSVSAEDQSVTLVGCGDESRAGTKSVTTGKVSWAFGRQKNARYKILIMMVPGPAGSWRIRVYQPVPVTSPAGRECR